MTNCVLMSGLGSTSDCGHTPPNKSHPYSICTLLSIHIALHPTSSIQYEELVHTVTPTSERGGFNNGKNYSQLYRSWDHSEVWGLCTTIIPWDANITAWSYKIAHWFQFPLQRTEPRWGWESNNILCNYSPISVTGHGLVFCHILSLISTDMLGNSCE